MNRVRLLPIVIVAAAGLFVLKTAELVTSGQTLFAEDIKKKITREEDLPSFARALARHRFIPPPDEPDVTGSVPSKKDAKKDEKKAEAKKEDPRKDEGKAGAEKDPKAQQMAQAAPAAPAMAQPLPQNTSAAERAILERLQERRGTIDERGKELELRENLLKAAEKKVDSRLSELKQVEDRITAGARAEKEEADKQMKTIVIMYENMKPKDAARVFDRLNISVLVPIATSMNPRKMSEVLAVMSPEAAERLTVALATRARDPAPQVQAGAGTAPGELPRIDQVPLPQRQNAAPAPVPIPGQPRR